jgi:nitric oxide reductase NorD protein
MSLDEELFGWAHEKWKGFRSEKKLKDGDKWEFSVRHIEFVGGFLLGEGIRICISDTPVSSKINCIYFAEPSKRLPTSLAESFLWLKLLFHSACVQSQRFKPNELDLSKNIIAAKNESSHLFRLMDSILPALNQRLKSLNHDIDNSPLLIAKRWREFRISKGNFGFSPLEQLVFPSFPIKERRDFLKTRISSTHRSLPTTNPSKPIQNPTEIKTASEIKIVELSKDGENPLVHVFEKVLTADTYQTGSREHEDSDDEGQSNALKELKVDQLARASKEIHSRISTDLETESMDDILESEGSAETELSYPEWFETEQKFRENWCHVKERTLDSGRKTTQIQTPQSDAKKRLTRCLKSEIENVFQKARWVNRERDGSDIDLDALVHYRTSPDRNSSTAERVFLRRKKVDQDFALLLVLDVSASTDAWVANRRVFDELRSLLQILAAVFEETPEKIGVSSFSSDSRLMCSYGWLKHFEENWTQSLARIQNIEPRGYTRMGVALRHSQKRLLEIPARRRGVLLLTDAKPTDFDRYEGSHGRGDVRKAIEELEAAEIRFLSLILSERQERSFHHLFGTNRCEVVRTAEEIGKRFVERFISCLQ